MLKRVRSTARELALALLVASISVGVAAAQSAGNGILGVFFDTNGSTCEGTVPLGGIRTLYVLLAADGDTRGGIAGAEFRIETNASGYRFFGDNVILPGGNKLGDPLGSGTNVYTNYENNCTNGTVVPILSFQVQSLSGGNDAVISIEPKNPPSSTNFSCPLVTLCDYPTFTSVCLRPGKAVLNSTGSVVCGSGAASSEWGRVKELYR